MAKKKEQPQPQPPPMPPPDTLTNLLGMSDTLASYEEKVNAGLLVAQKHHNVSVAINDNLILILAQLVLLNEYLASK